MLEERAPTRCGHLARNPASGDASLVTHKHVMHGCQSSYIDFASAVWYYRVEEVSQEQYPEHNELALHLHPVHLAHACPDLVLVGAGHLWLAPPLGNRRTLVYRGRRLTGSEKSSKGGDGKRAKIACGRLFGQRYGFAQRRSLIIGQRWFVILRSEATKNLLRRCPKVGDSSLPTVAQNDSFSKPSLYH